MTLWLRRILAILHLIKQSTQGCQRKDIRPYTINSRRTSRHHTDSQCGRSFRFTIAGHITLEYDVRVFDPLLAYSSAFYLLQSLFVLVHSIYLVTKHRPLLSSLDRGRVVTLCCTARPCRLAICRQN